LDKFLGWCERHRSPRTFRDHKEHIQDFIQSLPDSRMPAQSLKPFHVIEWVDNLPS
jgi:hypothetical protein